MIILKIALIITVVFADEIILLNSDETNQDDWLSSQNDKDDDTGANKWTTIGANPFIFYVCRIEGQKQDNFLRTPFVNTLGARYVYVQITYQLNSCTDSRVGVARDNCEQSFHLHAKESDNPDDTGKVDEYSYPLANDAYTSIVPGSLDTSVSTIVPIPLSGQYKGVFFAFRDTGACIKIKNIKVSYQYCAEDVTNAVRYNETLLAGEDLQVTGMCVENAFYPPNDPPIKYCKADGGTWQHDFQKSDCFCERGFQLQDQICKECESGWYKRDSGNREPCRRCPAQSMSLPGYSYKCECVEGHRRANDDNVDEGCILPPEPPNRAAFKLLNKSKFSVSYTVPIPEKGLQYKIKVTKKIDDSTVFDIEGNAAVTDGTATISDLEPDQEYIINFKVRNGSVESEGINFLIDTESESNNQQMYIIIIACLIGVVVLIIFVASIVFCKRKKRRGRGYGGYPNCRDPMLEHGKIGTISTHSGSLQHRKYVPISKYASEQEALRNAITIDVNFISLDRVCGQGQFGDVWKGTFHPPGMKPKDIAAKVLKDGSSIKQKRDFLMEASIMVQFEDPNVIELLGVVRTMEKIMIITEYMNNGCLKDYLKEIEGKRNIIELLSMARGIVSGMKYLAEMNFIHRDLAARNILVDESGVCKVSDFGLSRILEEDSLYYKPQGGQIPVRWTAPEAIVHRKYTQKSDVYSMGVVLWEIVTFGAEPWGNVTNDVVLQKLKERQNLPQPVRCPDVVYEIMKMCWLEDYTRRPTFAELYTEFDKLIVSSLSRSMALQQGTLETLPLAQEEYMLSVAQWLQGMGLSQYQSHFMNTGWDTIDRVVLMEEEDLQKIGITLAGHQKKIKNAIDLMKAYTMSSHGYSYTPEGSLARGMPSNSLPRYNTLPNHTTPTSLPLNKFGTLT